MTVSRVKRLMVSLFLLGLIVWIVEGLIASERITFSVFSMPDASNMLAESFEYLILLVFFVIAAGSLTVIILDRRMFIEYLKGLLSQPRDESKQSTLKRFLAFTIGFGVMFTIIWFSASSKWYLGIPTLDGGNQSSQIGDNSTLQNNTYEPQSLMPTLWLVSGVLLIVAVFTGGLLFIQAAKEAREEALAVLHLEEEVLQEKALNVIGEAISEITVHEGDLGFRAAIIKCYERLCELLAQHNCQIQKHETVQEFRVSASKLLNIPDKPFSTLTNLFEEARYSVHEINEAKRNEALKCLEEIKNHLTSGKP
ncbi:MAG: DUF4129 domain-containing protein [Candidatus Bathyarchaeia archaeon]